MVILLLGVSLVGGMVLLAPREVSESLTVVPLPTPSRYENDDYVAPEPDRNPPDLIVPRSVAEAEQLTADNDLYKQTVPQPIRCELSTINPSTATWAEVQVHADQATACLMKQWAGVLEAAGYRAVRPTVTLYENRVNSECGSAPSRNAFYCARDQQVYYAPDLIEVMPPKVISSRLMINMVLAHEFAHAIQARTGILISERALSDGAPLAVEMSLSRRTELQADCMAGLYVNSLSMYLEITDQEVETMLAFFAAGGDDALGATKESQRGHGTSKSRMHWAKVGLEAASPALVGVCNTWTAPEELLE